MKSKEQLVSELLGQENISVRVGVPVNFYGRLVSAGRRKYGSLPKSQIAEKAILNAAAIGLIDWEKDITTRLKKAVKAQKAAKK